MNSLFKNLGLIIFLCGVVCLCVYYFSVRASSNGLLVSSLVLEFVGILAYIIINKRLD